MVSCPLHVIKYETVFYVFMAMCELFEVWFCYSTQVWNFREFVRGSSLICESSGDIQMRDMHHTLIGEEWTMQCSKKKKKQLDNSHFIPLEIFIRTFYTRHASKYYTLRTDCNMHFLRTIVFLMKTLLESKTTHIILHIYISIN